MKGQVWLCLAILTVAMSGCSWQSQEMLLQPNEEVLAPQSNQAVIIEYFPFNMSDFPSLKERLKEAIRQDFKERYGKDPLEVRIGFFRPLAKGNFPIVPSNPQHDRVVKVFEEYMDQIITGIKSSQPIVRIATTTNPTEFCRVYKAFDRHLERSELVTKDGWIFSVHGGGRSFNLRHVLQRCYNLSLP